ncbi:hypothetical protein ACFWAR_02380 [Streptomyces sp. NPDC059917]|uniref:hypothetical protein n=1 Tax=Streptomyces sp. NPDC059917 TaxID=3347002 RepID=UPI003667FAB6
MSAAPPDALDSVRRRRLRPGVTATALAQGLHLRGWSASVTLEGSAALPGLWRMLEEALRADGAADLADRTPVGTQLRTALCTLIRQLDLHGMLVEEGAPPTGGAADRWLRTVADRPAEAAAALRGALVEVHAPDPGAPVAAAALRALARTGVTAEAVPLAGGAPDRVLLSAARADGRVFAVGASVRPGAAFVTPVGGLGAARADAEAIADRLRPDRAGGPDPDSGTGAPPMPEVELAARVAGAAVQRLVAAVADLPDPGEEDSGAEDTGAEDTGIDAAADGGSGAVGASGREPGARIPVALVVGERAARAAHHPWLGPGRAAAPAPRTLAQALVAVAALGDERLGPLPSPEAGALPQLPVALVHCAAPGGAGITSGGVRADLARIDALCRTAELRAAAEGPGGSAPVVGAGPGHARGRALRRAALAPRLAADPPAPWDPYGSDHPQARLWWRTLTERLRVRAELTVTPLVAGGGAHRADVHGRVHGRSGPLLGQAVEATAADAAAFAVLAALVRVQAGPTHGTDHQITAHGGELCVLATTGVALAPWEDERWTAGWWSRVADREEDLRAVLTEATGLRTRPWTPVGPGGRELLTALRQCGFTALDTGIHANDPEGGR